jgi:hypothetical protein
MALISYQVGMTMHIGNPSNNEYIKKTLEVKDFDTELDFSEQIQKVHATFHQLAQWGDEQLANAIMEALDK